MSAPAPAGARRPRVVIVGAGFAGLQVARGLGGTAADVVVVDRRNHHLFQPLLYQVATAALSPADIAAPIRSALRRRPNARVLLDEAQGVDPSAREVLLRSGRRLAYDALVIATGSTYSYFGHDDWAAYAPSLKTVDDATEIRRRLLLAFETAESSDDPAVRARCLTFVMVGGGPTGVEMAGAVAELARLMLARDFRTISRGDARILLIEAGPRLLNGFPERLGAFAVAALGRMGIEVRLDIPIEAIDAEGVVAAGTRIPAATVIWCAGVRAGPVASWLGVPAERNGAVAVGPDLSVPGRPEVFVIGDASASRDAKGRPLPGLAAVADQQGRYLGRLLAARLSGRRDPGPFRYKNLGTMATIGRSAAVAHFRRFSLTGRTAWLLWCFVHIYLLIGFRNRLSVFLNWMWSFATWERGARLITGPAPRETAWLARTQRSEPIQAVGADQAAEATAGVDVETGEANAAPLSRGA